MKLWHVAQWGNSKDFANGHGGNGPDTNCIVAATDLEQAVAKAQEYFSGIYNSYKDGQCDVAYHLGDDGRPDGEAQIVIHHWVDNAFNMRHYPAFYRDCETSKWLTQKEMYGDLQ